MYAFRATRISVPCLHIFIYFWCMYAYTRVEFSSHTLSRLKCTHTHTHTDYIRTHMHNIYHRDIYTQVHTYTRTVSQGRSAGASQTYKKSPRASMRKMKNHSSPNLSRKSPHIPHLTSRMSTLRNTRTMPHAHKQTLFRRTLRLKAAAQSASH